MDNWQDRTRWANAPRSIPWFCLLVYGLPTLYMIFGSIFSDVPFHPFIVGWGTISSLLSIYLLVIIHKAKREIESQT